MDPLVIIGSGFAGYSLAKNFRLQNPTHPMLTITQDKGRNYSKPKLSTALSRGQTPESLGMENAETLALQWQCDIHTQTKTTAIDPLSQTVHTDRGDFRYSRLVLAVGAKPIPLPVSCDNMQNIFSVNHLEDYEAFMAVAAQCKRIAILGAGLVGCEFANDFILSGYEVSLIGLSPYPLDRFVIEPVGNRLKQAFEHHGVVCALNVTVEKIIHTARSLILTLSDGRIIEADVVLSAIGLKPNLDLAKSAGLSTHTGILTDAYAQTSDPNIYALGDCAEIGSLCLQFIAPIKHTGTALAKTLNGIPTRVVYPALSIGVKTSVCFVSAATLPPGVQGQWQVETIDDGVKAILRDTSGLLRGFALANRPQEERSELLKQMPPLLD